jgi:hypothetical protein
MNKFADYMDRVFFWRSKGASHQEAKKKAIEEMKAFGLIKDADEIWSDIQRE